MKFLKKYHRWVGLFFSFFLIMFAWSGIVMNHRQLLSTVDVPRKLLPAEFRYDNWNNASIKGTFRLSPDSILMYGGSGVWLTDSLQTQFADFTAGIARGADNRNVSRIARTASGDIFVATTFGLYRLQGGSQWTELTASAGIGERLTDIEAKGDTLVVLSRSYIYYSVAPFATYHKTELPKPADYKAETNAFRTMWLLHSGQLFGIAGELFVDLLGVLLIIVSATGLVYFFCPSIIRRRKRKKKPVTSTVRTMKTSIRWHNRIGLIFLVFFLALTLTGMFLRPPLLIAIVRQNIPNLPGSILDSSNPWNDKLRTIRYNAAQDEWLLYTSSGFYVMKDVQTIPRKVAFTPPVSVMGVTVLEPTRQGWLVGSFSGLFYWNTEQEMVFDCYTGRPVTGQRSGRPVSSNPISGYSIDFGEPVVFEYGIGARNFGSHTETFAPMPPVMKEGRISLWHLALEVHTGRIYGFLIGSLTDWYILLAGLLNLLLLISGYLTLRRRKYQNVSSR